MWCDAPLPLYFLLVVIIAFCIADHNLGRMGAFDWWVFVVAAVAIVVVAMCSFLSDIARIYALDILWTVPFSLDCAFYILRDDVRHCPSDCGAGGEVGSEDAD